MRLQAIALCAATFAGVLILPSQAVADPGSPGCVTRAEYGKVRKGMTQGQVHATFGTAGKRSAKATSGGFVSEIRTYKTCSAFSTVAVSYSANPGGPLRLSAKSAVWVG
jgi:hypothetical protein